MHLILYALHIALIIVAVCVWLGIIVGVFRAIGGFIEWLSDGSYRRQMRREAQHRAFEAQEVARRAAGLSIYEVPVTREEKILTVFAVAVLGALFAALLVMYARGHIL